METIFSPVEALHTNHQWFAQLQPAAPDGAQPWVRILCIRPGAFGDPIYGRLTVEALEKAEPFDALSYSCGLPILSHSITVNDASGFRITQNLWNALQRVRKVDGDRRLWVDAVCIDQDDDREKSSQVRQMHSVYGRAEEVCIYFGECAVQVLYKNKAEESVFRYGRRGLRQEPWEETEDVTEDRHLRDEAQSWASENCQKRVRSARKLLQPAANSLKSRKEGILSPCPLEGCIPDVHKAFITEFLVALEYELLGDFAYDTSLR